MSTRPESYRFHNGTKTKLPFSSDEYETRIKGLREIMSNHGVNSAFLTSMHSIAYYTGFLYCSFGRPYGLVITMEDCTTISAGVDAGQPWRRCYGDNITYTDWGRDNYWRVVTSLLGNGGQIGIERDHMTLSKYDELESSIMGGKFIDISVPIMQQRIYKSPAELDLIRAGAQVADVGGFAIRDAIKEGVRELDVAMAGRDAMELEIAKLFPDAEYRDTWVWIQSDINSDGAHNPVTGRVLKRGDILSVNAFPMISGYYTALERTMFVGEVDADSLKYWKANVATHELGISLLKPGAKCLDVVKEINDFLEEQDLLQYRTFGYGHSFGVLSHYYGREAGLELREDIETVLEPGMVISMEPMLTIGNDKPGAGGYREHDILIIKEDGNENITKFPYGPDHNVIS